MCLHPSRCARLHYCDTGECHRKRFRLPPNTHKHAVSCCLLSFTLCLRCEVPPRRGGPAAVYIYGLQGIIIMFPSDLTFHSICYQQDIDFFFFFPARRGNFKAAMFITSVITSVGLRDAPALQDKLNHNSGGRFTRSWREHILIHE